MDAGTLAKVYAIFGILLITLIFGLAPFRLTSISRSTREYVLAHFSFFTGGVFLGAGMIHMLPDAAAQVGTEKFPYVYLLACVGFVAVFRYACVCVCTQLVF
jgi:predicted permease